jgi:dienelactone hydrolase
VDVTPSSSLADRPVHVTVSGLEPHAPVSVDLRSTDARGVHWTSSARFRANGHGVVDLDRAAPAAGDYSAAWGMGLVTALKPRHRPAVYAWDGNRPLEFMVRVRSAGEVVASATFRRRLSTRPLAVVRTELATDGFVGRYIAPVRARKHTAVLVFGGSEGGLAHAGLARALAARGYPTLLIAYFGLPRLPRYLTAVPLEYFTTALQWLRERREVDPGRVFVLGISRGSEAALLLGVHFPQLVHGVIASVPSSVVNGPTWTLGGRFVPFTLQFANPRPLDDPRAAIPVERVRGPVFAYCAENDSEWSSCTYARAIVEQRENHGLHTVFHDSAAAGHRAGLLAPFLLTGAPDSRVDEQAREQVWPRLLAFLEGAA